MMIKTFVFLVFCVFLQNIYCQSCGCGDIPNSYCACYCDNATNSPYNGNSWTDGIPKTIKLCCKSKKKIGKLNKKPNKNKTGMNGGNGFGNWSLQATSGGGGYFVCKLRY